MTEKVVYMKKSKETFIIKYKTEEEEYVFYKLLEYARDKNCVLETSEALRIIRILGLAAKKAWGLE